MTNIEFEKYIEKLTNSIKQKIFDEQDEYLRHNSVTIDGQKYVPAYSTNGEIEKAFDAFTCAKLFKIQLDQMNKMYLMGAQGRNPEDLPKILEYINDEISILSLARDMFMNDSYKLVNFEAFESILLLKSMENEEDTAYGPKL